MARTQTVTASTPSTVGQYIRPLPKALQHNSHAFHQSLTSSAVATLSVDRIPSIPGFRTSAAFLSSLGANLRISDDELLPTPLSTPPALRPFTELNGVLPPPSPLARAVMMSSDDIGPAGEDGAEGPRPPPPATSAPAKDPLAGVPELTTFVASADEDKIAGLKLIADSIAQQRQTAARALLWHPLTLLLSGLVLAHLAQRLHRNPRDLPVLLTTLLGLSAAALVAVRWLTRGYILRAEALEWSWLGANDAMLVTRFGDRIIGCCVLAWEKPDGNNNSSSGAGGGNSKGASRRRKSGRRGLLRAWTVELKYRRNGVGRALLEDAVELVNQRGGDGIAFAENHANSARVLKPDFFNAPFDSSEARARVTLDAVVAEHATWRKR